MATKQTTTTANALARELSKRLGRTISGKVVRQWSRDNIARFGDDKYTAHEYSAAEVKAISAAFAARGTRSRVQPKGATKAATTAKAKAERRTVHKAAPAPVPSSAS